MPSPAAFARLKDGEEEEDHGADGGGGGSDDDDAEDAKIHWIAGTAMIAM